MATHINIKIFPNMSNYITCLLTYINRIITVNRDFFMYEILQPLLSEGLQFQQFLVSWFKKMDHITSRESLRINLISIYMIVPFF